MPVPPLGDILAELGECFGKRGALGVLLVDCSLLESIEVDYGQAAYARSLEDVADIVRGVVDEALGGSGFLATGEVGRGELCVLMPRGPHDASYYKHDLPALARMIAQRLERKGGRVGYPYLRTPPTLPVGYAFVIRNPRRLSRSQLRSAMEEARRDAQLNGALSQRDRRREFTELLVSGDVRSVYEPIVDAKTLTVYGYEALIRGPEGSPLESPLALFGVAEAENLLFELDCLCRRKALEGAIDFPEGAKLFMNIRPTAIHDPSFQPAALMTTLNECGLSPSDVVFEISEQESIENYEIFREARDNYGKLGFEFALDDTGAGYASFEAVMELQPEYIKVDRTFCRGIDNDAARQNMVRAFQHIAERMNARIIGEGLDTLEELRTLGEMQIHFGQGWLFGKPTPLRS